MRSHSNNENALLTAIIHNPDERLKLFRSSPRNLKGRILFDLPRKIQLQLLEKLHDHELVEILNYLDPDKVTDILQLLPEKKRVRVLKELSQHIKDKVKFLLKFDPRTAAGMMSLDYIEVDRTASFKELLRLIEKHEKRTGRFPAILVVEDNLLVGELPPHIIGIAKKNERISRYVRRVPHIRYDQSEDDIIRVFKKHPHNKIVVLDEDDSILGIIYSDDILRLIEKKSLDNLRDFAGVSREEDVFDPPLIKVKNRYKWLIINLFTAFLAASVVALFEKTIAAYTLLAIYMPIVAGMGGNAGTQTLAVVVRGLTLGEIDLKTSKRVIINEMIAGAVNGIINGILVALVAFIFNKNPLLGLIVALAMVMNLIIAGFFGATIPLILKSLGKDPASSATVFITTATDVFGFFVFLGLATIIL
ncbi:magnesium transporter [Candidatus Woesearchaeota archaeon]|nr:magnesium transporter [Candidatus Woesearchaeota archaeon]